MKKAIAGLLMVPCMASAEFVSGNMLLDYMTKSDTTFVDKSMALGYVMGVFDVGSHTNHCPPSHVTTGQVSDIVKQYLQRNPALRHKTADVLVMDVLKQTWPCVNRGGNRL